MKKKIVMLLGIGLLFGGVVAFSTIKQPVAQVRAEEEVVEETTTTEEELKELYEKLKKEYDDIMNKQILGTSIGALVGGLGTVLIGFLVSKTNKVEVTKVLELARRSASADDTAKEYILKANELYTNSQEKVNSLIDKYEQVLSYKDKEIEEMKKVAEEQKAQSKKQMDLVLQVISNTPELVANGTAELLNKQFGE